MPDSNWFCINQECGSVLGSVLYGELKVDNDNAISITRGPNLEVECKNCHTKKVWYTSDTIVKATYQLIDAVASVLVRRVINQSRKQ